jgi:hypothetical protein
MCRFSDAGNDEARYKLGRPASEKRQDTKSREVGHRRCRGLYGDLAATSCWRRTLIMMVLSASRAIRIG